MIPNTYRGIGDQTNPTISEYCCCHFLERCDTNHFSTAHASFTDILYIKYNRGVKNSASQDINLDTLTSSTSPSYPPPFLEYLSYT